MMLRIAFIGVVISIVAMAQEAATPDDATPSFRVETRLVEAYASVFDKRGNPLPNLTREHFQLLDNGQPQKLLSFESIDEKFSCALLLDLTGSMDSFLPVLKNSVAQFVDQLRLEEEVGVYTFNTSLHLLSFSLPTRN